MRMGYIEPRTLGKTVRRSQRPPAAVQVTIAPKTKCSVNPNDARIPHTAVVHC